MQCSAKEKCSVNVVSSDPRKNQRVQRSSRSESNWLHQWSNDFLQEEQGRDPIVRKVKNLLLETTERPKLNDPSPTVNTLLRQWERFKEVDNILYRVWEKGGGDEILQLVVPITLLREIMQQLHNNRTAGHLGREDFKVCPKWVLLAWNV